MIGLLLAAVAFELLLRHLSWFVSSAHPEGGSSVVYHRLGEGWGVSHWDSRGIRLSASRPSAPRVLAIGDSFTEAFQVDDDEVYTARLEDLIGAKVLNAGRSSQSPADYVLKAPAYLAELRPAWTVIQLNASDLSDDGFKASQAHFSIRNGRLVAVGPPTFHYSWTTRFIGLIRPHVALLNQGIARGGLFRSASHMPPLFRAADRRSTPAGPAGQFSPPVEGILSLMETAYGGRLTFFFLPDFEPAKGVIEKRFLAECSASRLSCADFREAFDDFSQRGRAPFGFRNSSFGHGHLNPDGHRAAAAVIARELSRVRRSGLF